ncbi:MAG: outer membrane protein assembly factor BamD [Pseudomonadota bacterium]|nr:outer membrane protein assembly factor BamD [Pseudomonadota bacterium]
MNQIISTVPQANKTSPTPRPAGLRRLLLVCTVAIIAAGCAGNEEEFNLTSNIRTAYADAQDAMSVGNYRKSIGIFEALQARFPFSQFATQIQLELAYCYYKLHSTAQAVDAADTFIRENPTHSQVDYAMYVKGLAYFEQDQTRLERLFRKSVDARPPRDGELAFSALSRMIQRYPASPYAADARQRMIFLRNRLASYENAVARFYLEHDAYVAALNRAKTAIEVYQGADSADESLRIMIECYEGLGMTQLAEDTRRVLEKNFSDDHVAKN